MGGLVLIAAVFIGIFIGLWEIMEEEETSQQRMIKNTHSTVISFDTFLVLYKLHPERWHFPEHFKDYGIVEYCKDPTGFNKFCPKEIVSSFAFIEKDLSKFKKWREDLKNNEEEQEQAKRDIINLKNIQQDLDEEIK